jgi:hypothetical protein
MDEEIQATLGLNGAAQFPYIAIAVPWSSIPGAYRTSSEPIEPPLTAETAEVR